MAFVTFGGAVAVDMNDQDIVRFGQNNGSFAPGTWSWLTPDGHDVDMSGNGLSFDAEGRALTGRINLIQLDLNDDGGLGQPDVKITGLNVAAPTLDDRPLDFWNLTLAGNDIINAQAIAADTVGFSYIFGDDLASIGTFGADDGGVTDRAGNDVITLGAGVDVAVGDTRSVAGGIGGGGFFARYDGGDDQILAQATDREQALVGDAEFVGLKGTLLGGDDLIHINSTNADSVAVGDARFVQGDAFGNAVVFGGDDEIEALGDSDAALFGDVVEVRNDADITGGDDAISGSRAGEFIVGDVGEITRTDDIRVVGGDDTMFGNDGEDFIVGDVGFTVDEAQVIGGDDVIHGGADDDVIFGEFIEGFAKAVNAASVKGGDDLLFGDAGDDRIFGQTGRDQLDGGSGADELNGGAAFDFASYESAETGIVANLANARANTGDAAGDTYESIEGLIGSNFGDVLRGNSGANHLDGGAGNDSLFGGKGEDTFVFKQDSGFDRVTDYADEADRIDLSDFGFVSFKEVKALATDTKGGDLRIDFGDGDALVIKDFSRAELDAGDLII